MTKTQRKADMLEFLARALPTCHDLANHLQPLGVDASARQYFRLPASLTGRHLLLMDSPPDLEPLTPYVNVAAMLRTLGLSAPQVFCADSDKGFAIIEDWGEATYARVMADDPTQQEFLYRLAVDSLIVLQKSQSSSVVLPVHDAACMRAEISIFLDWFPLVKDWRADRKDQFLDLIMSCFTPLYSVAEVPVLGDFHRDNLMLLAGRVGVLQCGLLDFQDAMWGHPLYDLMSLCEDARRDVPRDLRDMLVAHYRAQMPPQGCADFEAHWAMLACQRHLRILGVFMRLRDQDNKSGYMRFLPRVADQAQTALRHPALAPVQAKLDQAGINLATLAAQESART